MSENRESPKVSPPDCQMTQVNLSDDPNNADPLPPKYDSGPSDAELPPKYDNSTNDAGPPPKYDSAPPPSYDSIKDMMMKAKENSNSNVGYAMKMFGLIVGGTIFCILAFCFGFGLQISHIVLGSLYLGQCTAERYIPIYLIVSGSLGLVASLSNCVMKRANSKCDDKDGETAEQDQCKQKKGKRNPIGSIIGCFLMGWFITGTVWIYRIYKTVDMDNELSPAYCPKTLYLYAFWTQTVSYIIMLIVLMCTCIGCCVACCLFAGAKCDMDVEKNGKCQGSEPGVTEDSKTTSSLTFSC